MNRARYRAAALAALLIIGVPAACGKDKKCGGNLEDYNGKCVTHTTALYVACVDAKEKNLTQGVELGATLPVAADSTFKAAYTRSRTEDSTAALQFVKDCLTLAEKGAAPGQEAAAVRDVQQKTSKYINVVQRKLPAIEVDPPSGLDCGPADIAAAPVPCGSVTIKSTGVAALRVSRVEATGANGDDFKLGQECTGKRLNPAQGSDQVDSCTMTVQFQPSGGGTRNATLVIHQNLPAPDRGTRVQLAGTGTGGGNGQGHSLTVTVKDSAPVAIASNPPGIDCGTTCVATFDGADVALTATHTGGQVGWAGCDVVDGDTCHVQLTADRTVSVNLV